MRCIDFFAGGGYGSLGLKRAGFEHVLFVEDHPWAVLTLKANYWGVPVDQRNLFLYKVPEILTSQGIDKDFDGLVWLSPPCQGHSLAGNRGGEGDARNSLLWTVWDACNFMPEAWVVMENVPGLLMGNSLKMLEDLEDALVKIGRRPKRWVLDAIKFGVPSKRERLFLIIPPISWGKTFPSEPSGSDQRVSVSAAIGPGSGFRDIDPEFPMMSDVEVVSNLGIGPGEDYQKTDLGRRYHALMVAQKDAHPENLLRRPKWDKPYSCIVSVKARPTYRVSDLHPEENRFLSIGERRRLLNLPEDYLIAGPIEERIRMLGNCVCPDIAEIVGRTILEQSGLPG